MKILVVDDGPMNLKLLRAELEADGHTVYDASDGVEALALLQQQPCDAIISDILMPRMDGYRLCQEVHRHPRLREIPFIFFTATYISPDDEKLCMAMGADKYLRKPATAEDILAALKEVTTSGIARRSSPVGQPPGEVVMKEYNARLVAKLDEKNAELQSALGALQQEHTHIAELNAELERRVRARTADLEAANRELESFSYSVSHDLRAPLRHIDGYVKMLTAATEGQLADKPRRYLQTIAAAAEEMGQLIDDLLAFSRTARVELRMDRVPLDGLAQEAIRGLEMATQGRAIEWRIAPLPEVMGDPAMLKQVLANLIGNAVKYTGARDPARIEIGAGGEEDGRAIVFVRDNGAGFDMQYAHKLFGVFQRLHRAEEFEGTGIGLATVQRIVARHGGRVWAEGKPGEGATFYFTLQPEISAAKERKELKG